jgi:hypothetical protein
MNPQTNNYQDKRRKAMPQITYCKPRRKRSKSLRSKHTQIPCVEVTVVILRKKNGDARVRRIVRITVKEVR